MKWILRVLMALHIGFFVFGAYCMVFKEEYIYSSKYVFVGLTGFFLFLNAFLLIPMTTLARKILMIFSLVIYAITVLGFLRPEILKSYWLLLVSGAILIVLNSLFVRLVKAKKNWEAWSFPILSFLIVFPFLFDISIAEVLLVCAILLGILSIYLLFKVVRSN